MTNYKSEDKNYQFLYIHQNLIKNLPFESNIKNNKHRLLNIGEDVSLTPNRDMFFNFLIISTLLFLALFAIYNAAEKKTKLLSNKDLIEEMQEIKNLRE